MVNDGSIIIIRTANSQWWAPHGRVDWRWCWVPSCPTPSPACLPCSPPPCASASSGYERRRVLWGTQGTQCRQRQPPPLRCLSRTVTCRSVVSVLNNSTETDCYYVVSNVTANVLCCAVTLRQCINVIHNNHMPFILRVKCLTVCNELRGWYLMTECCASVCLTFWCCSGRCSVHCGTVCRHRQHDQRPASAALDHDAPRSADNTHTTQQQTGQLQHLWLPEHYRTFKIRKIFQQCPCVTHSLDFSV